MAAVVAFGGYVLLRPVEAVACHWLKSLSKGVLHKGMVSDLKRVCIIIQDYADEHGLSLKAGESIRVVSVDEEMALITKSCAPEVPYVISISKLREITGDDSL